MTTDLAAHARELLDLNRYLTLGTVGADGRPWTSPVYFSWSGEWDFYWMSELEAQHSLNIAVRPDVSLVVYDSTVQPYHGRAVYASGEAQVLAGDDLDRGLARYPGPSNRDASGVDKADVTGDSPYRLFRVTASDLWVLCPREPRMPCALHGLSKDHRARVA